MSGFGYVGNADGSEEQGSLVGYVFFFTLQPRNKCVVLDKSLCSAEKST